MKSRTVTAPTPKIMNLLQTWADEEFQSNRTGVHFLGWKPCTEDPDADAIIFVTDQPFGEKALSLGVSCHGPNGQTPGKPWVHLQAVLNDNSVQTLWDRTQVRPFTLSKAKFIHELGHLVGLEHEDWAHPDPRYQGLAESMGYDFADPHFYRTTSYDAFSVMSYSWLGTLGDSGQALVIGSSDMRNRGDCNVAPIEKKDAEQIVIRPRAGLSEGDVQTLQCLYLYNAKERARRCGSDQTPWNKCDVEAVPSHRR